TVSPLCNVVWSSPLAFFFSSRRRHTRSTRDWSSDVCSSDLLRLAATAEPGIELMGEHALGGAGAGGGRGGPVLAGHQIADGPDAVLPVQQRALPGAGGRGLGLLTREGARGRQRRGGVDPVDRGAPVERAVLPGGAHELLLDADVPGSGRGAVRTAERSAALPAADQPGQGVQRRGE